MTKKGNSKGVVTKQNPQVTFIGEIKTKVEAMYKANITVDFLNKAPSNIYCGRGNLHVKKWYYKDVLVCAPHMNYPKVRLPCRCGGCYKPSQWADERTVYGMSGPVSLLQYRYECDKCKTSQGAPTSIRTMEMVKTPECPDLVANNINQLVYLTHNGGVSYSFNFFCFGFGFLLFKL